MQNNTAQIASFDALVAHLEQVAPVLLDEWEASTFLADELGICDDTDLQGADLTVIETAFRSRF